MPNHTYSRQSIPDLERKLIEIEIRVEEIALIFPPSLKHKVLSVLLREEELLSRAGSVGYVFALPDIHAVAICAFFVDNSLAV